MLSNVNQFLEIVRCFIQPFISLSPSDKFVEVSEIAGGISMLNFDIYDIDERIFNSYRIEKLSKTTVFAFRDYPDPPILKILDESGQSEVFCDTDDLCPVSHILNPSGDRSSYFIHQTHFFRGRS